MSKILRRSLGALALVPLLLLACGGGAAKTAKGTSSPPAIGAEAKPTLGVPLLWEAKGEKGTFYLYGTIHTGGADLVPPAAWQALERSTIFVMEMDTESLDPSALAKRGIRSDDKTLQSELSPAAWKTLVAALAPMGIAEEILQRFQPWFAAVLVLQTVMPGGEATDLALRRKAKARGITLVFLETADEQLDMMSKALDVASLELLLADLGAAKQSLVDLLAAYKRGDAAAIERLSQDPTMSPEAQEQMFFARNARWIPKLEAVAEKGPVFVAVGAGHLPGERGVIGLLEKAGYTVTRVAP
jgi:hypothetical protein